MHALMLINPKPVNVISNILTVKLTKAAAASTRLLITNVDGTITFDVAGSSTFTAGNSVVTSTFSIPLNAEYMYIKVIPKSSGALQPAVAFSTTLAENDRIIEVVDWSQLDPRLHLRMHYCRMLVKVPNTAPPTTNWLQLFNRCFTFNQDISGWDTSHVTSLSSTFLQCLAFNQPLNTWDVSSVTNMTSTFQNCSVFNQPLNNWNVNNVTIMNSFMASAPVFNQNLSNLTFPLVTVANRTNYAIAANAWVAGNRPSFAIV